jgi:uncharacterized membrane protein
MVDRAFDKIRQAGYGMPAVIIRLLDALDHIAESTKNSEQRAILVRQAKMIMHGVETGVSESDDVADIRHRSERFRQTCQTMDDAS